MTDFRAMRNAIGDIYVGPRHPRANTAFAGEWMAADMQTWDALNDDPAYSFADATGSKGWCVVGDDPVALEQIAIDHFSATDRADERAPS